MAASIPLFIINLPQATSRRQEMQARLANLGLNAEFIEAVDGRRFAEDERESHVDRVRAQAAGWALSPSEIGCALSHIKVYRRMVEQGIAHAIVLEDDVELAPDFPDLCKLDSRDCLNKHVSSTQAAMIQLTHVKRAYRWPTTTLPSGAYRIVRPFSGVWLTSGYLITQEAARALAQALYPVWSVADDWTHFEKMGLLSVSALTPHPVWEAESANTSSIETGRSRNRRAKPRTLQSRLHRLWTDAMIRPFLTKRLPAQKK